MFTYIIICVDICIMELISILKLFVGFCNFILVNLSDDFYIIINIIIIIIHIINNIIINIIIYINVIPIIKFFRYFFYYIKLFFIL